MSYLSTILADSPALLLRLGEASGTTASDSSGNGRNGSYVGSPALGIPGALAGDSDTACTFNGSSQAVTVANGTWLNQTTYSVEAWFKSTSTGIIVARDVVGSSFLLSTNATQGVVFTVTRNTTNAVAFTGTGVGYNDGNWHHVVGTWDGTTARVYFDGTIGSTTGTGSGTILTTTTALTVARRGTTSPAYLAGTVDEVAFYSAAVLNSIQITAHRNAGITAISTGAAGFTVGLAAEAYVPGAATTGVASFTVGLSGAPVTKAELPFTVGLAGALNLPYVDEVLLDSPLLYWRLNDTSGTTAADASGNSKTGTYVGSPTKGVPALINAGTAVDFSGTGQYVDGPAGDSTMQTGQYTVEAWVKTTNFVNRYLANRESLGVGAKWRMILSYTNDGRITISDDDTGRTLESPGRIDNGGAHHVVMVQDATTLRLYVDGAQVASGASTAPTPSGTGTIVLGARADHILPWIGTIDEFAVYGTALSATRVLKHYTQGTAGPRTAGALPFTVGLTAEASTPGAATTGVASFSVGLAGAASSQAPTIGAAGFTVGLAGASTALVTTGAVGFTVGLAGAASGGDKVLSGWTADNSQQAVIDLTGPESAIAGSLVIERTPTAAPGTVIEHALIRQSHIMGSLAPDAVGRVHSAGDYTINVEEIGVPHLWIDGLDVTYFRDIPTDIGEWGASLPFGDDTAVIRFPQMTPWDIAGVGDLSWLYFDAPVEIAIIDSGGNVVPGTRWDGRIVADESGNTETNIEQGWHCRGVMSQSAEFVHRVPIRLDPTDIGMLIPKSLNGVISRRYGTLATVNTGIRSLQRGSYGDTEADYVSGLLSTAWTDAGRQWTVSKTSVPKQYAVALKPAITEGNVTVTVTSGAPGVEISLSKDGEQVLDAIYGQGVDRDGYSWAGWVWPGLLVDDAPDYPFTDPSDLITLGTTDGDTDSGTGVTDWQERMRALGYKKLPVDGSYGSEDAAACRDVQRRYGISVDGIVGPQTWSATFAVGSNAGTLDGAYRRPLAARSYVEPNLYSASGAITGSNPAYDPSKIRREIHVDFGTDITRAEAVPSAVQMLNRSTDPGWVGTVVFAKTDPHQKSRWEITEGEVIKILGWRGTNVLASVVEVRKTITSVTVTVDTKARDAMTVSAIMARDRDAKIDPARRPGNVNRRSRNARDQLIEYEPESGAGIYPNHAINGDSGLWDVIHIPVSEAGSVKQIELFSSGPQTTFAVGLFASPITAAHMNQYVGNPTASEDCWETNRIILEDRFGFIEGWGSLGQMCGYFPGDSSGAVTGAFVDSGGFDYWSNEGGWVWVATWASTSCRIKGRVIPNPVQ